MFQFVEDALDQLASQISEFYEMPGYGFILAIVIGGCFVILGIRIYRFVLALIAFLAAGFGTHYFVENFPVAIGAAVATGIVVYLLHYVFVLAFAGVAVGGVAFSALWLTVNINAAVIGGVIGLALGVFLAVRLFHFLVIVTTSCFGAAMIAPSVWILWGHPNLMATVNLAEAQEVLDPFRVALTFAGLVLLGLVVQGIIQLTRRQPREDSA